jgi:hypothetical protein
MIKEQNTILNLYQRNIKLIMTKSDKENMNHQKIIIFVMVDLVKIKKAILLKFVIIVI